jgi:hypothetical protein
MFIARQEKLDWEIKKSSVDPREFPIGKGTLQVAELQLLMFLKSYLIRTMLTRL